MSKTITRPKPDKKRLRRTMMFMNAQKPGLIKDAYIYGSDSIILDLEDAVAENQMDAARFSLYHALKSIDYGDTDYRYEIEGDNKNYNYEKSSLSSMGYQQQEFDEESGELVNTDDDDADEEFDGDFEDDLSADSYEDEE